MWLTSLKFFANKAWVYIKQYWKVIVSCLVFILAIVLYRKETSKKVDISKILSTHNEDLKEEIKQLETNHKEEQVVKQKIEEKYQEQLVVVKEKYKKDSEELTRREQKEIKKIVEENHDDPSKLAKDIADKYGFEYVQ